MTNPFIENNNIDSTDIKLVKSTLDGSQKSLEELIERHQGWIYNIALRMVMNPHDAEDVTQEVLIKIITKLSTFKAKSSFRTWLYRIVKNYVLNMKKSKMETMIHSFKDYGDELYAIPDADLPDEKSISVELNAIVEDAKIACMTGMLLCLDREQRMTYVLGEVFELSDKVASEIFEISKDNFRQKLSRSRKQLHSFMNEKCGLINKNNSCRCAKKTGAWIQAGFIDPNNLKFNSNYLHKIKDVSEKKSEELCDLLDVQYAKLFRDHPFQKSKDYVKVVRDMLNSRDFQDIFNLTHREEL